MTAYTAYIAGPMSGIEEFNFPAFDAAKKYLEENGIVAVSPADLDRESGFDPTGLTGNEELSATKVQEFARRDLRAIMDCDKVYVLPGWESSTGATNEVKFAGWLGKEVWTVYGFRRVPSLGPFGGGRANARSDVLLTAESLVNGDRNVDYGDPKQDFRRTAAMWSAYLGKNVAHYDVAAMMAMLKISRIRWSPGKRDSWVDLAGYAACGWDCASEEEE